MAQGSYGCSLWAQREIRDAYLRGDDKDSDSLGLFLVSLTILILGLAPTSVSILSLGEHGHATQS